MRICTTSIRKTLVEGVAAMLVVVLVSSPAGDSQAACFEGTEDPGGGSDCHKLPTSLPCVTDVPDPVGFEPAEDEQCGFHRHWLLWTEPCGRPIAVESCFASGGGGGDDPASSSPELEN